MPRKITFFFYLSFGCSLIGFIFPTHVSQAIGFDIGDMIHWVYGFYILIPRNPVGEPQLYFSFQGFFLLISAIILLVVSFVELRKAKFGNQYNENLIYVVAIILLMAGLFQELYGFIVMRLSSWVFIFSAIFAIMGNRELKIFYINENIINAKKERILGIVLVALSQISLVYTISMILIFGLPFGLNVFSLSIAINMFPGLFLQITLLFYGIYSLKRAKLKNELKFQ